jgi:flagellar biosynthesis protein FlhG
MPSPLPLHHAANLVGIEPSRLQFIGCEFREFLACGEDEGFDPRDFSLLREIHERLFQRGEPPEAIRVGLRGQERRLLVVAVTSGKGGVGKTTVSVNLAVAFAQQGCRVLLLDADLGMANVHVFAGIQPRATLLDFLDGGRALSEVISPGPGGIDVICGPSGITRVADLDPRRIEQLGRELGQCHNCYDVLLLDTGAGISAQVMQFLALAEEIVVVATPNLASTLDAYGVLKVMHERRLAGRVNILVNQADSAAQAETVLGRIAGCARQFLQFSPSSLGFLPRDPMFEAANQSRCPLVLAAPAHENARRFLAIAQQLLAGAAAERLSPPCTAAA